MLVLQTLLNKFCYCSCIPVKLLNYLIRSLICIKYAATKGQLNSKHFFQITLIFTNTCKLSETYNIYIRNVSYLCPTFCRGCYRRCLLKSLENTQLRVHFSRRMKSFHVTVLNTPASRHLRTSRASRARCVASVLRRYIEVRSLPLSLSSVWVLIARTDSSASRLSWPLRLVCFSGPYAELFRLKGSRNFNRLRKMDSRLR